MKIYKDKDVAYIHHAGRWYRRPHLDWDALINRTGLYAYLQRDLQNWEPLPHPPELGTEPPIGSQEVWAAGVTYLRSKVARMEEAEDSGGSDFYDRVYDAPRPELFFKATAGRTVGSGGTVHIRRDSSWNVPEPELTLFCSSAGTIEGYTIGNDMSSRSIEGENPLYLPQAKIYDRSAGLGPCIYVTDQPLPQDVHIHVDIMRDSFLLYTDQVAISRIKRSFTELTEYLFRECSFPHGCFLMTGTSLVPDNDFTLQPGDEVRIRIDGIGELINYVGQKSE